MLLNYLVQQKTPPEERFRQDDFGRTYITRL